MKGSRSERLTRVMRRAVVRALEARTDHRSDQCWRLADKLGRLLKSNQLNLFTEAR